MKMKLVVIALFLGMMNLTPWNTGELFAQRNNKGNRTCQQQNQKNSYLSIPGITEDQKQKITSLQTSHQNEMKVLRDEKRGTRSMDEKNAIDEKMTAKINSHKAEVKALLTPEQQKYFDENCGENKRIHKNTGTKSGQGRGNRSCGQYR